MELQTDEGSARSVLRFRAVRLLRLTFNFYEVQ